MEISINFISLFKEIMKKNYSITHLDLKSFPYLLGGSRERLALISEAIIANKNLIRISIIPEYHRLENSEIFLKMVS